eukprot:TRINITY_DN725_c2_g1_i2.p1 TRINITY_DN725_c2_g1~~TRINITY_DN725_c2_g1_i2.p1  ORF type:complete len:393 (-),score=133.25 TRINITY_DN725_c2_g1_i2:85-1125(-)
MKASGLLRLLMSLTLFIVVTYFELVAVLQANLVMDRSLHSLPDLGFRLIEPAIPELGWFCNFNVGFLIFLTLFRALYHRNRLDLLRRYFVILSSVYILRALCIISTCLPDPYPPCKDYQVTSNKSIFLQVFDKIKASFKGEGELDCGDVFFSGHTAVLTSCSLLWTHYTTNIIFIIAVWLLSVFTCFCMLAARFHYTIDILFGFLSTIVFWYYYHRCAFNEDFKRRSRFWAWWETPCPGASLGWIWNLTPCLMIRSILPCTSCPSFWGPCDLGDSPSPSSSSSSSSNSNPNLNSNSNSSSSYDLQVQQMIDSNCKQNQLDIEMQAIHSNHTSDYEIINQQYDNSFE